ncbi:MAG: flagellar biosynthesis protein FlgA [Deltaproteobacteria bacterium RIFOXYA12_FULL_61_11]|nr:MAG: flagellar biosynthesis protein FlgA [Deltaproteobacteria bacterium RIFOXYA12_FULL_61_11]
MKRFVCTLVLAILLGSTAGAVRIKDISAFKGVRVNELIGYGLVVGLNGTGDREQTEFTVQSLTSMLGKLGIGVDPALVKVRNVAAVLVTAKLPPFAKIGSKVDVLVSSIGDARSLQGGTLVLTPLKGPNQKIYGIAQGPVLVGGYGAGGANTMTQRNHVTVGKITNGGVIEREVSFDFNDRKSLELVLNVPDFTTIKRVADVINGSVELGVALAKDSGSIAINVPETYFQKVVELVARIENLDVTPDAMAKVVLNERTGTLIIGENVRISTIAISHGNLTISIAEQPEVSQPNPLAQGKTTVTQSTQVKVEQEGSENQLMVVPMGVTIGDVVKALNALGVSPRDMIAIFQSIKAAGALQADLEII